MPMTKEDRCALLEKARAKKKEMMELKKGPEDQVEKPKKQPKVKKEKEPPKTLDLTMEEILDDVEVKNEVIRIKAPKKKTIIKRVIEVEEPSSEEEVQEEIVKVPRKVKTVENKAKAKTTENNQNLRYQSYMRDIFPS